MCPSFSFRSTSINVLLACLMFAVALVAMPTSASAMPVPTATVSASCVNGGGVIEFTMTGGAGGTDFIYRVSGLEERVVTVAEGDTVTKRRSGRRDGVAYAASVLAGGVLVASESLRIVCGEPPVLNTVISGICVDTDGRIRTELTNTGADPLSYEIDLVGAEVAPFVGVVAPGESVEHTRSGRTDRIHEVVVSTELGSATWPVEIACEMPRDLGAIIESYCEDSGGVIAFRLRADAELTTFVVSVSGLDDRAVEVEPFDVRTSLRTGRRDGTYTATVAVDGQVIANAMVPIDCVPDPVVSIEVNTDCADGAGRIGISVVNSGQESVGYEATVRGVDAPSLSGRLDPGEDVVRYRTGRRDGDWVVDVSIDGGDPQTFQTTVDCVDENRSPDAQVVVECVNGDGSIIVDISGGGVATDVTVAVSGLDDRTVSVAPGESERVYRSGRRDGEYQVSVSAGEMVLTDQLVVVACDPDPEEMGVFVEVTCADGFGVFTITLTNGDALAVDYSVTTLRSQVAPFEGVLEPGETKVLRRTGRLEGDHVVIATIGGETSELPVVVDCQPDVPDPTPTGVPVPGQPFEVSLVLNSYDCERERASIGVDLIGNEDPVQFTVLVAGQAEFNGRHQPNDVIEFRDVGPFEDATYQVTLEIDGVVVATDELPVACVNPAPTAVPTSEPPAPPTPTAAPEPTVEPTPVPTLQPTLQPATPAPTPTPTVEPSPPPTVEPTPTPVLNDEPDASDFIDSHADGQTFDTSPAGAPEGFATGSIELSGLVSVATERVEIRVGDAVGEARLTPEGDFLRWSLDLTPTESKEHEIEVRALDGDGGAKVETLTLSLIAATQDDVLYNPEFVEGETVPPAMRYDAQSGELVFAASEFDQLSPGLVLHDPGSGVAPDGYLRIVDSFEVVGDEIVVETSPGGLLDVFRQIEVDFDTSQLPRPRQIGGELAYMRKVGPVDVNGVKITTTIEAGANLTFELDIDWCFDEWLALLTCFKDVADIDVLHFEASAGASLEVEASAERKREAMYKDPWFSLDLWSIPVGPVEIRVGGEFELVGGWEIKGKASLKSTLTARAGGGYEYRKNQPSRDWYRIPTGDESVISEPTMAASLGVSGNMWAGVSTNVNATLYGTVGPELRVSPRLNLEGSAALRTDREQGAVIDWSVSSFPSVVIAGAVDLNFFSSKIDLGDLLGFDIKKDIATIKLPNFYEFGDTIPVLQCGDNGELELLGIDLSGIDSSVCPDAPDTQDPTLTLVAPEAPMIRDVAVSGEASDDNGVQFVRVVVEGPTGRYWDGDRYRADPVDLQGRLSGSLGAVSRDWDLELGLTQFGPHTISATAVDTSGNESEVMTESLFVFGDPDVPDVTDPRVSIIVPDDVAPEPDEAFALTGEAWDDIEIATVEVTVEDAEGLWWNGTAFVEEESSVTASLSGMPVVTWTSSFTPPEEGAYVVTATATDLSGNDFSTLERLNAAEPPPARLSVEISADPLPAEPGAGLALTYSVRHFGTERVSGVAVLIELPEGLNSIGLAPGCEAQANPGEVLCIVGPVDVDEVREFGSTANVDVDANIDDMVVTATVFSVSPLASIREGQDALSLNGAVGVGFGSFSPPGCFGCRDSRSWGDPHLVTFDGLAYDFQTVGEFTLYRSSDGRQEVQVRHQPWGESRVVSTNAAVAALVGDDTVMVSRGEDGVIVNGELMALRSGDAIDLGDGAGVSRSGSRYTVGWPGEGDQRTRLVITNQSRYQNVQLSVPDGIAIEGLLGDGDGDVGNDLQLADGTVLPPPVNPLALYGPFADSWRVTDATSLFTYQDGENTDTYTDLSFPDGVVSLADLDPEERALAEAICRAAGVTNAAVLDACILDLVLTGNSGFALGAISGAIPKVAVSTSYLEDFEDGSADGWSTNIVGSAESGSTKFFGPHSADDFRLTLTELPPHSAVNVSFDLNVLGPWSGDATALFATADDGTSLVDATFSNTDGAQSYPAPGSPAQTSALSVDDLGDYRGGGSATYRVSGMIDRWEPTLQLDFGATGIQAVDGQFWSVDNVSVSLERVLPEVFAYEVGQQVIPGLPGPGAGSLEVPRAEDTYLFTVDQAATELLVDFAECTDGGLPWELRDPQGTVVVRGGCTDTYVYIAEPGEYSMRVFSTDADTVGDYAFGLTEVERLEERIPYSQTVLNDEPIRYQRFEADSPEDDVAAGVSVAYADTAVQRGPAAALSEPGGNSISSPDSSAAASFSAAGLPSGSEALSIEFWFRGSDDVGLAWLARYGGVVGLRYNDAPGGGAIVASLSGVASGQATFNLPSGLRLADEQWHHVVMTFDGTTAVVYIDGFAAGSAALSTIDASDADFELGYHAGDYDEVAVYARALSGREVAEHFAAGTSRAGVTCAAARTDAYSIAVRQAGAVRHYRLDDRLTGDFVSRRVYDAVAGCLNGSISAKALDTDGPGTGSKGVTSPDNQAVAFTPSTGLPGGGESRSLELWFRGSDDVGLAWLARYGRVIGLRYNDSPEGGAIVASLAGVASAQATFTLPGIRLSDDEWHHVVLTYDGATDTMAVFVDSLLVGEAAIAGTLLDQVIRQGLVVGDHPGDYADVAVYASALTAAQVSSHFTLGLAPTEAECASSGDADVYAASVRVDTPVGYLPLDPSASPVTSDVAYDLSENCGNGAFATGTGVADGPGGLPAVSARIGQPVAFAGWSGLPGGDASRSIELWFRGYEDVGLAWLARYGGVIGLRYNDSPGGGDLVVSLAGDADAQATFTLPSGLRLGDGNWHHVVLTYDAESDVLSAYVDSLLVGQKRVPGALLDAIIRQGLVVGGHPGDYAHAAVYEAALTAEQVSRHFTLGLAPDGGECVAGIDTGVYAAAVLGDAPVGYAPLDLTASQEVAYDLSDQCVNGAFATGVTGVTDGPGGLAAVRSPASQSVAFAGWPGLPGDDASRSIEFWFRGFEDVGLAWLARYGGSIGLRYNDALGGGQLVASLGDVAATQATFSLPGIRLGDGGWHHVVLTYDDASDALSVFVDSLLAGQATVAGSFLNQAIDEGLVVGGHPGDYAHVAVYASALTAQQVSNHFTLGIAPERDACSTVGEGDAYGALVIEDSPVGYLPLDQSADPDVADDVSAGCVNGAFATATVTVADGPGGLPAVGAPGGQPVAHAGWSGLPAGDSSRSIEFWFRGFEDVGLAWLIRYGGSIGLRYNDDLGGGQLVASLAGAAGAQATFGLPGTRFGDGGWHHVVLTYDGVSEALLVYADSQLLGEASVSGELLDDVVRQGLVVGSHPGDYAHVAIYDQVLSGERIAERYETFMPPG